MPPSINIINPHIMASSGGGGATTTKVQVRFYQFSGDGNCTCSLTSTYEVWENDPEQTGGDLTLSVNDVISGYAADSSTKCAIVTALNSTSSADGQTVSEYSSCSDCNDNETVCEGGGGEGYCLLPHMLVKRIDGSLANVIDLNVGDLIEGPSGHIAVNNIDKEHPRSGYYIIEGKLYITNDHPIQVGDEMITAENYPGEKEYINERVNTVNIITSDEVFNVYCDDKIYTVSGRYSDLDDPFQPDGSEPGSCCK